MNKKILLLEFLISQVEFKSSNELAEVIDVSSKTITRYIKYLNEILNEYGFNIESRQGMGFGFNISDDERIVLKKIYYENILPSYTVDLYCFDIFRALLDNKYYTFSNLSKKLYQSETVLYKNLRKLRIYLNKYNLDIRNNTLGYIEIFGDPEDKIQSILNYLSNLPEKNNKQFLPLVEDNDYKNVYDTLETYVVSNAYETSDIDLWFMVDLIMVCLNEVRASRIKDIKYTQTDHQLHHLFFTLCKKLNIQSFYNYEKVIIDWITKTTLVNEDDFFYFLRDDIVKTLSEFDTNLTRRLVANDDLINQLVIHIRKFIYRTSQGLEIENPILNDVKKGFPFEFSLAYYLCKNIEKKYKAELNEDEIGFIAVYLATQKELTKSIRKDIVIICHYGIGTANFIKEKLQNSFPDFNIVGIFSYSRREEAYNLAPDLVVSSIKLYDCPINYLYMEDIFNNDSIVNIKNKTPNKLDQKYLIDLLDKSNFYEINESNSMDVIKNIGNKLLNEYKIDEKIIEEVLERERISSTDIGNLVAIPHTISEFKTDPIICLNKLDRPIKRGNDFVQLVFFIVFSEVDKENLRAFNALYDFIEDSNNIANLIERFTYENFIFLLEHQ